MPSTPENIHEHKALESTVGECMNRMESIVSLCRREIDSLMVTLYVPGRLTRGANALETLQTQYDVCSSKMIGTLRALTHPELRVDALG